MTAADLVDKLMADEHADVLRDSVAWLVEELMNAEVTVLTGAELGERAPDRRQTQRNGYRQRRWDTRVGELELAIPKLRQGSYFPSFLEPRRRAEQALVAVVQEAYVNGISTRKVDRLVEQLGLQGMTKDTVSRLCRGLDEQVTVFRERPLAGAYPYLWLDAKVERVRERGGVRHKALVIAYGVHQTGRREVVGLDVGEAETESFWRAFLRGLRARGLDGVQLVISDAHTGLKTAIAKVFGCPWQRCTVHFLRDMLGHVSRTQQPLVSGAIRQIFTAASAAEARERLGQVTDQLRPHAPKVARLLEDAEADLLAFYEFPAEHWSKLRSTNPLERVNREIGRRTDVVGIFPNDAALLRLAGMLLLEQNDEWLVGRRYLSETSMTLVLAAATGQDHDREELLELTAS
ncbi:MAG TPA: IS256 family transposase [Actinomycetes bacterium]|nr:IS256 family transposase [Actinomycetes bacterium]